MKKIIIPLFILSTLNTFGQNDSSKNVANDSINRTNINKTEIADEVLDEIVVDFKRQIQLKQNGSKYEINLEGTNFKQFPDTWEGMKSLPLLQTKDREPLKINGKTAIVEIDGIRTELNGEQLENYLRSLNPENLTKIELISNPGAMYDSSVGAVVNIVLKEKDEQYQFSVSENGGIRTKPFSYTNVNYSQNFKKLYLYANYNFVYSTLSSNSETNIYTPLNGNQNYILNSDNIGRSHNLQLNLVYQLNEKNNVYFSGFYTGGNVDEMGLMNGDIPSRSSHNKTYSDFYRFSQVWKSQISDKFNLKVGSYQVVNTTNSNFVAVQNNADLSQKLNNDTPIIIGFADASLTSKLGITEFGTRFHSINQKNENQSSVANQLEDAPFTYNEKVLSFYINHSYQLSDKKSIVVGLRTESTFSDYSFKNSLIDREFSKNQKYTNLLYNIGYYWNNEKVYQSLAFRKQISRPNYAYINPFKNIGSDITQSAGDMDITPALHYSLNYEILVNKFVFSLSGSYVDNYITSFMDEDNGVILTTYKNFDQVYLFNGGVEYNESLFNKKWNLKPSLYITLPKMVDNEYDIKKPSPITSFSLHNVVDLGRDYMFTLYFNYASTFKDGLLKHRHNEMVNVSFSKRIKNLNFTLYANDIFKTYKSGSQTLLDNYSFNSQSYNDFRSVGLSIRYTLSGKNFRAKQVENIDDKTMNRL